MRRSCSRGSLSNASATSTTDDVKSGGNALTHELDARPLPHSLAMPSSVALVACAVAARRCAMPNTQRRLESLLLTMSCERLISCKISSGPAARTSTSYSKRGRAVRSESTLSETT
jgi:hypothetical protein